MMVVTLNSSIHIQKNKSIFLADVVEKTSQAVDMEHKLLYYGGCINCLLFLDLATTVKNLQYEYEVIDMRVAICDDEQKELSYLQSLVEKYDPNIDICLFRSAESLLNSASESHFEVLFLDIEMGGMNGFAAAKKLKEMQDSPLIVFVTNSGEYTYRGYEVAFRYLAKPVTFDIMATTLAAAMNEIMPKRFIINVCGSTHVISVKDIRYIETFGHRLVAHTKCNKYECRMKLSEAKAMLPANVFVLSHKGLLVNLEFVDTVQETVILLTCGLQLPISRRNKKEFERALFRFIRRAR
jgi:DNA-binding LytR/AlgR family response regulator